MGGCFSSDAPSADESKSLTTTAAAAAPKKLNKADFIHNGKHGETIVRWEGGTRIAGQQFVIEECKGCTFLLFDHLDSVNMDACKNCKLVVGPCSGAIFIRECEDCEIVAACQQFRTRDCHRCDLALFAQSRPIVESSKDMRFGCYDFSYAGLREHFAASNLTPWTNHWSLVHDFTPGAGHFSLVTEGRQAELAASFRALAAGCEAELTFDGASVVPRTWGHRPRAADIEAVCFGVFDAAAWGDEPLSRCLAAVADASCSAPGDGEPKIRLGKTSLMAAGEIQALLAAGALKGMAKAVTVEFFAPGFSVEPTLPAFVQGVVDGGDWPGGKSCCILNDPLLSESMFENGQDLGGRLN